MAQPSNTPRATVGILSIGDMGAGIARLLSAHNYRVLTNAAGRSPATEARCKANNVELLSTDLELCNQADYILSIVPQRDAVATAERVIAVSSNPDFAKRQNPLYFLDLNAISPSSARANDELFAKSAPDIRLIDGGIIGGPPKLKDDGTWARPSLVVSGPNELRNAQPSGAHLAEVLNVRHINATVGSASGLKMCFAAINKGFTALALQSLTTAHSLGVVDELQQHMTEFSPRLAQQMNGSLPAMPPKAYRWILEMVEIAKTFEEDGGFSAEENLFHPMTEIYRFVTDGSELGKEQTDARKRGKTAADVALSTSDGLERRKLKQE